MTLLCCWEVSLGRSGLGAGKVSRWELGRVGEAVSRISSGCLEVSVSLFQVAVFIFCVVEV